MTSGATAIRRKHIPMKNIAILAALVAASSAANAAPNVQITEIMYTGLFGEFVEITNVGDADQSMTDWKFSDNRRGLTGSDFTSLSQIGTLSAGECAIITEVSDAIFIQAWYTEPTDNGTTLASGNIVENNSVNLGRSDEVNIYPSTATNGATDQQDRVTYNDQGAGSVDGPRSEDVSAIPEFDDYTATFSGWVLSEGGATDEAWKAGVAGAPGPVGSPGVFPNF